MFAVTFITIADMARGPFNTMYPIRRYGFLKLAPTHVSATEMLVVHNNIVSPPHVECYDFDEQHRHVRLTHPK